MTLLELLDQVLAKGGLVISPDKELIEHFKNHPGVSFPDINTLMQQNRQQAMHGQVIVYDIGGEQNRQPLEFNLARLRDLFKQKIYIIAQTENCILSRTDFISLGYCLSDHACEGYNIYYFSLRDYKRTPDWLNSKFWANPQMWDKSRW